MTFSNNEAIKIMVVEVIRSEVATSSKDGTILYGHIIHEFRLGRPVIVSFAGVKFLISAFLNTAIGLLYRDFDSDFLNSNLKVIEVTPSQRGIIRAVAENAKLFYSQEDKN